MLMPANPGSTSVSSPLWPSADSSSRRGPALADWAVRTAGRRCRSGRSRTPRRSRVRSTPQVRHIELLMVPPSNRGISTGPGLLSRVGLNLSSTDPRLHATDVRTDLRMSADLSAPRAQTGDRDSPDPDRVTALDHPPRVRPPRRARPGVEDRRSSAASMLRLRPYLRPYRWRFVVMIVFAAIGIGAVIVIPLVTRAVIDGPIASSDRAGLVALGLLALGLGVLEAVLMFFRRWIVTKGTIGVETQIRRDLYAKLQRLPMSFHSQWQSGQLLSRIMNDLSTIRRFLGFGLHVPDHQRAPDRGRLRAADPDVLASGTGGARFHRARRLRLPAQRTGVHPAVAAGPRSGRRRRLHRGGGRVRPAGDQGLRAGAARVQDLRRPEHPAVRDVDGTRPGQRAVLDLPQGDPQRDVDPGPGRRGRRRRAGPGQPGDAGRLHHVDVVPGVAGGGAGLPAGHDAGGDDGGGPDLRDLRRRERDHRRSARRSSTRREG